MSRSLKDSSDDDERPATAISTENDGTSVPPASPSRGQSKVKSWFTGKFHRSGKTAKDREDSDPTKSGFVGGASLTGAGSATDRREDKSREGSMRDVAMAGRSPIVHQLVTSHRPDRSPSPLRESQERQGNDNASVSTLSDSGEEASGKKKIPRRGRLGFRDRLVGKAKAKTSRDIDEEEEFEEARDNFEEEQLAPPPKLTAAGVGAKPSGSPVRDSRFSEIL